MTLSSIDHIRRIARFAVALAGTVSLFPLVAHAQNVNVPGCQAFPLTTTVETVTPVDTGRQLQFDLAPGETKAFAFNLPATASTYADSVGWSTFETNQPNNGAPHEIAFSPCPGDFNYTNAAGQQCKSFAASYTGTNSRIANSETAFGACMMPGGTVYMNVRFTTLDGTSTCPAQPINTSGRCQQWNEFVISTPAGPTYQAIAFGAIPAHILGDPPFTLSATGGASGNPVTFASLNPAVCTTTGANGATLSIVARGTCVVTASQQAGGGYEPAAPVFQMFSTTDIVVDAKAYWPSSFDGCTPQGGGCYVSDDLTLVRGDGAVEMTTLDSNSQPLGTTFLMAGGSGWSIKLEADFNGDGKADILWQHTDGRIAIWIMDGATQVGGGVVVPAGTGWTPVLAADFNGDGKADLLWTHTDGRSAIWLMDGASEASGAGLVGPGTGWTPSLAGDFNGDGKSDILWTHADGRLAMWLMDGTTQQGGALLLKAGSGWVPRLLGDFNGDAKADILLQHQDGRAALWLMGGTAVLQSANLLPAATGWSATRLAYWNEDAKADIIWQKNDGAIAVWTMDGITQTSGARLAAAGAGFKVVRTMTHLGPALRGQQVLLLRNDGLLRLVQPAGSTDMAINPTSGWIPSP